MGIVRSCQDVVCLGWYLESVQLLWGQHSSLDPVLRHKPRGAVLGHHLDRLEMWLPDDRDVRRPAASLRAQSIASTSTECGLIRRGPTTSRQAARRS